MNAASNNNPPSMSANSWMPPKKPFAHLASNAPMGFMGGFGGQLPMGPMAPPVPEKKPTSASAGENRNELSSFLKDMKKNDKDKGSQMVTIRRVMDPVSSEPTVTITLKGDEPEKDKVLFKLVNGQGKFLRYITFLLTFT